MAELKLHAECPVRECPNANIPVPVTAVAAVRPLHGGRAAEIELRPKSAALRAILIGHFLEWHPDMLDPELARQSQLTEEDLNQLLDGDTP